MQKGNALLIVLLLVLIVGVLGYFLYSKGYFGAVTPQSQTPVSDVFNYGSTPHTTGGASSTTSGSTQETGNVNSDSLKLSVTYPTNGATLSSAALTVTGKTSPGADVFINDQTTKAGANGNFSLKISLDEGKNGLVVTANDDSGNVVEQDLSVNVQSF